MTNKSAQYHIGIDLGTTHTVVAYAKIQQKNASIQIFEIEQLVAPGEVASRPLLPSVRYHPAWGELSDTDMAFSPAGEQAVLGQAARVLSAKTQGRFVSSAKSWLSHPSIDHTAPILPWGSSDDVEKISPLDASASYLKHVRQVWNHKFPNALLENQHIVITVPASFDEGARSLTLEAAHSAGFKKIHLLEEPQAVCYDWLRRHQDQLKTTLDDIKLLLVCDVGGGTTDLTLIKIEATETEPKLSRIGVGDHLMLGGDNIDLALAHLAESRLNTDNKKLSAANLSHLLEQCRIAKERLLAEDAPEQLNVTLLGGGSKLIGGTRSVSLTREEVKKIALDGFFPLSKLSELPDKKRSGVVEFGLPYAAEPAISKHIAAFLNTHRHAAQEALGNDTIVPDALLLNGGVFRSQPIRQRTQALISSWRNKAPVLLKNEHPELSVAYGAVSYGIAREQKKIKIGGGASRSYFLLVGTEKEQQGICILPRGSEEGNEIILKERQFSLRLGQPVSFHLTSLTGGDQYKAGELVNISDDFHPLPPLAVAFDHDNSNAQTEVTVQLSVTLSAVGTLQIQCVSVAEPDQRWDVQFQIRKKTTQLTSNELPEKFPQAVAQIEAIFGSKSKDINPKAVKSLRADLEKLLGLRSAWSSHLLRELFTVLLEVRKNHRRSANHERVWLSLIGYCLRPGFGYQLDNWRVEQLWKTYQHNIQFVNETQNWTEWWILWRRISGGLDTEAQELIFNDLAKYLNPASARQGNTAKIGKQRGYDDMVRLAAVLERLPIAQKTQLGEWLLKRLEKASEPAHTWWAVGRIGARVPFHASAHFVVPPETATLWLEKILKADWKKIPQAGFAATLMSRMSGDRARDIDETLRSRVIAQLTVTKAPNSWLEMVESTKELNASEEQQIFGEALPPGLTLINR
ncbi:Hsp70 family protein [methanotrophic endosymbiont of Bathymodiolus puteoserpentis (Logatchev)]|uniref:Hsp70 family protein n=1 Tax=methanotrophic endosymbiont of Bathymodiolus puteoserpentis (Logatchev) TaxID=343235 RepID=UPI00157B74AE|nr:Hsp70 family protein [methanotrophic endosymbiont of Bathymodiolus puteoserpentis (Logatchev)]